MNATTYKIYPAGFWGRLMKWPLLCALLGVVFARASLAATGDTYQNDALVEYPGTVAFPPMIDDTNFVNNGTFIINFTTLNAATLTYETWNTLNYTNNGLMVVNTGFNFDKQTLTNNASARSMSSSFYNVGDISCASFTDTNIAFFLGAGQFLVSASNIFNPGTVTVGFGGLMKFDGKNVDLTRSLLTIEGFGIFGLFGNLGASGLFSSFGGNTNLDWNPNVALTPTTGAPSLPVSALLPTPGGFGFPSVPMATTPYFQTDAFGTNLIIVRAVFVNNPSPNVTYNVYFDSGGFGLGEGNATVEWVGPYVDAASGETRTNYLYLNNNYLRGVATNIFLINGIPDNFTFTESQTPFFLGPPAAAGFPPGFSFLPNGPVTNRYSYVDAQLSATTVGTNTIANGAITNLPGRIYITASNELTLDLAEISGQNYMSLTAPKQFNGSDGALIVSPYSDINVGVTNGFLTVSNLVEGSIPNWSGLVQAWSVRWIVVTNGVTNDFRVLLVSDQIAPTSASQVQDLILHGTNSVVISDTFNVIRKLSIDAQNLTLTTNGAGVGATSLAGELNLGSLGILFQNSLPNLRNLTNNGAIRAKNQVLFGGPLVVNITTSTQAVAAVGTLSQSGAGNAANNDKVTIGSKQYSFVGSLNNATPNQIKIGTTFDTSMSNFIAGINGAAGAGTKYSSATIAHTQVTASPVTNHAFRVTAITTGSTGNSIVTTTTSTHLTWDGHATLFGGIDFVPAITNVVTAPYDSFINKGLISDQGSTIWAKNFENSGPFLNGNLSFILQSTNTTLTNGSIIGGGDISITTGSLVASNVMIQGRSLTLQVTNLLTDTGVTNGNIWSLSGAIGTGLSLPIKPPVGDLLGTTISNLAPVNKNVINIWAGKDFGISTSGYTNNVAVGRLIFDALSVPAHSLFTFNGATVSNALYVDYMELHNFATNTDINGNFTIFSIKTNMVIYYAEAVMNGVSVAAKMNHKNGDRLRWVPAYAGHFSSTNIVYPDGSTNTFNAPLANSPTLDSDGDGIPNSSDATPFFVPSQWEVSVVLTNIPPLNARITWHSIPNATNTVTYSTNMVNWFLLTNFVSPTLVPPAGGWPITNSVLDPVIGPMRVYQVAVYPTTTNLYGP